MLRAPVSCREPECRQPSAPEGKGFCSAHVKTNTFSEQRKFERKHDLVSRMYWREPWPSFRRMMLGQNYMCQRLYAGVQCPRFATLLHHLLSPRERPDLFVDPMNVVCLCAGCHPTSEGTPLWRVGVEFVKTVFAPPNVG